MCIKSKKKQPNFIIINAANYHFDKEFVLKRCNEAYESNKENIDAMIKYLAER